MSPVLRDKFSKLGLINADIHDEKIVVDHAVIFGARAERINTRLSQTLKKYANKELTFKAIYLLGSNRKLIKEEIFYLGRLSENFPNVRKDQGCFTESDALKLLWGIKLARYESSKDLSDKVRVIDAEKIEASYKNIKGKR